MKKIYIAISAVLIAGMVLTACSTPPTEEMQRARDAVIRAESDPDAVANAGNSLIRAREALTMMENEANAKRYESAKEYAAEAISFAERAIAEGKSALTRSRDEAENLLFSLSAPLAETTSSLNAARQVQNIILDFEALTQDLDLARRTLDDAWQSIEQNNIEDAINKGQSVRSLLAGINADISNAAQATSRKQ